MKQCYSFVEGNGAIFMHTILRTLKDSRYDIDADGARQTICTIAGYFYTVKQENDLTMIYLEDIDIFVRHWRKDTQTLS